MPGRDAPALPVAVGLWDAYDHPKHQPVPIDRMAGVAHLLAWLGVCASLFCVGPSLLVAAIVLAHRVQKRLNPQDVAGARLTRTALYVAYPSLIIEVVVILGLAFIGLVFIQNQPAGIGLLLVFTAFIAVAALAFLAFVTIWLAVRISERGIGSVIQYRP